MSHSVVLSWSPSTDTVDGYNIYRGTAAGAESPTPVNTTLVTGTTYTDSTPPVGESFYTVKAVANGNETSVASNEVTAVILPAPPTNLVVVSAA